MKRLVLFAELYSTFQKERQQGLLYRNLVQYIRFMERKELRELHVFTYGSHDLQELHALQDEGILPRGFHVLTPPAWLDSKVGHIIYSVVGPFMHWTALRDADAYRTQQVTGSWTALIAKALHRKPLLFRVGYPLSVRFKTERKRLNFALARLVERLLVRNADHVAVASMTMRDYYGAMGDKANVTFVPNFVDVSLATPKTRYDRRDPVLFVGRLHKVKNIENIIRACARQNVALHLYHGPGDLHDELQKVADEAGATIEFKGTVPNERLLQLHHNHSIFILCSTREGMPKAMIEAMASGLICVATPTDGASELIEHGVTGYLTGGYDADAIEAALAQALREMNPEIGRRAREFVVKNLSLDRAVDVELGLFRRMVARHMDSSSPAGTAAPGNTTDTRPL